MSHPGPVSARRPAPFLVLSLAVVVLTLSAAKVQARHHHSADEEAGQAGQFDYYVLSLSWAPTYCLTHAGDGSECSGKGYGFVLHGLWPQYDAGGFPENCPTQLALTSDAAARGRTVYPSERLMRHEWREHGTCSGLDARGYFDLADRATAVLRIPEALDAPQSDQSLSAERITELFRGANPQLPAGALTLACSRDALSEVRVCLTRDLQPRACGRRVHSTCPRVELSVPASR